MKKIIWAMVFLVLAVEGYRILYPSKNFSGNPRKDLGMIPGAYQMKEFEGGGLNSLSYWVKMDFPAPAAVDFYEKKLAEMGWTPTASGAANPLRSWTTSIRQDPQSVVPDCGYIYQSTWNNESHSRTTSFTLTYYDSSPGKVCPPSPKNNELLVTVREW